MAVSLHWGTGAMRLNHSSCGVRRTLYYERGVSSQPRHEGRRAENFARRVIVAGTLTGVLRTRQDALRPCELSALQQAAVVGRVFWEQVLAPSTLSRRSRTSSARRK